MQTNDRAVATAHFLQPAVDAAVAQTRRWIVAFAGEHGMSAERRGGLAVAVSEAVTNVVRHAYDDEDGEIVLDAATDGEWLSVRVADTGCGTESTSLGLGLPLMRELADRVEIGPALHGPGTVVLMEFPMDAPAGAPAVRLRRAAAEPARPADVAGARRAGRRRPRLRQA
jgi:serine/threonine-protein kinase RsbW